MLIWWLWQVVVLSPLALHVYELRYMYEGEEKKTENKVLNFFDNQMCIVHVRSLTKLKLRRNGQQMF